MGYIRHNAIVVTSFNHQHIDSAYRKAILIFGKQVSSIVLSPVNSYESFFIAPDGSKEGWDDSDKGDTQRSEFKKWLRSQKDLWCDWVEIRYGGDDAEIVEIIDT